MNKPVITVAVTGSRNHVGATTVAAIIHNALTNAGFNDIEFTCLDGDLSAKNELVRTGVLPTDDLKQAKIEIHDIPRQSVLPHTN